MTTLIDYPIPTEIDRIDSSVGATDSNNFRSQGTEPFANEDDDLDDETIDEVDDDEPVDEDGDPTGEHDHHQDDNYALGGHVTRSGS